MVVSISLVGRASLSANNCGAYWSWEEKLKAIDFLYTCPTSLARKFKCWNHGWHILTSLSIPQEAGLEGWRGCVNSPSPEMGRSSERHPPPQDMAVQSIISYHYWLQFLPSPCSLVFTKVPFPLQQNIQSHKLCLALDTSLSGLSASISSCHISPEPRRI